MDERTGIIGTRIGDANPKPRGRPLKEKGNAAAELQRARVRRAQKAFRLRKEQHVASLEAKCRDLESVVEEMGSTFISFSDELLRSRKVDPETIRSTMEKFLRLSKRAANDDGEERDWDSADSSSARTLVEQDVSTSKFTAVSMGKTLEEEPLPQGISMDMASSKMVLGVDPLLNYSIWGMPSQSSSTDGSSAIPYILAGRDSFASRLYFETMVAAVKSLRGGLPRDVQNTLFRYKMQYCSSRYLLSVVSGIINVMLHGTSQDPNRLVGDVIFDEIPKDDAAIKAAIVVDVVSQGGSESDYLSSWQVEKYLKDKWKLGIDSNAIRVHPYALLDSGSDSDAFLERETFNNSPIFAPTLIPGFLGPEHHILNAESLVQGLSRAAVTLGEGPRWHFAEVDFAVRSFLGENYTLK